MSFLFYDIVHVFVFNDIERLFVVSHHLDPGQKFA